MKKFLLSIFMMLLSINTIVLASVPQKIAYQIMVLDPANGRIMANANVALRIEIRQGSENGTAVFGQDFNTTTDKNGTCAIMLDIPAGTNWSQGNYYFATLINGKLTGASHIASVPYALVSGQLDGVITRQELIGTWELVPGTPGNTDRFEENEGDGTYQKYNKLTYVFNADGTASLSAEVEDNRRSNIDLSNYEITFNWTLTPTGTLVVTNRKDTKYPNNTEFLDYFSVIKMGEGKCVFPICDTDCNYSYILTKKQ